MKEWNTSKIQKVNHQITPELLRPVEVLIYTREKYLLQSSYNLLHRNTVKKYYNKVKIDIWK